MKKCDKELTVVIPSHNEGVEVENTLASIRQTASDEVDVLLIDDASDDGICYQNICRDYQAQYYRNNERKGPARSRDLGISMTKSHYFLTVDSHMRFYHNDWWRRIVGTLEANPNAVYCAQCKALDVRATPMIDKPHFGAFVDFLGTNGSEELKPVWMRRDCYPQLNIVEIPCILGATYASSKQYWQHLKGLSGLNQYGHEEPYISIKAWLDGGKCYLIKDVEIGHLFRESFPYTFDMAYYVYNKLVIIETLLPYDLREELYNILRKKYGERLREAMEILIDNQILLDSLREYYQVTFKNKFEVFKEVNNLYMNFYNRC